uniref:Uncharacterized protein n=1 Tax=Anguilla anguilla TaxID=7936 RepID=A0A0E9PTT1_ANGAN
MQMELLLLACSLINETPNITSSRHMYSS